MIRFPERAELDAELKRRIDAAAEEAVRQGGLESISTVVAHLQGFEHTARRALLRTLLREHFEALQQSGGSLPSISQYLSHFSDESEQRVVREIFAEQLPTLRVELVREIGRGGMGVIYEARQTNVGGRRVAVKMLDVGAGNQAFLWNRLREEVDVLAQIDSPHVVKVFEVGLIDGRLGFVMELAEENLQQRTGEHPQDQRVAAQIVATLAVAVQAAHDHPQRLIHQDLKPSNVLVFRGLEYKVADFGLYRAAANDTAPAEGRVFGSPGWLAPEQARGETPSFATDVWGLGAILYFLLTGKPPFPQERARVNEVISQPVASPAEGRRAAAGDALDPRLEAIVLKCLSKEPKLRYRRPVEVADELRRYLNAEPVLAPLPGRARRRRMARLAGAMLLGAAAIAALVPVVQSWRSREMSPDHKVAGGDERRAEPTGHELSDPGVKPDTAGSQPISAEDQAHRPSASSNPALAIQQPERGEQKPPPPEDNPKADTGNADRVASEDKTGSATPDVTHKASDARRPELIIFTREFTSGQGGLPADADFELDPSPDLLALAAPTLREQLERDSSATFVESWRFELRPGARGSQQDLHFTRTLKARYKEGDVAKEERIDVRAGSCTRQMAQQYFKPGKHRFLAENERDSVKGSQEFFDVAADAATTALFNWKGATRNHYQISVGGEQWIVWSLTPKRD